MRIDPPEPYVKIRKNSNTKKYNGFSDFIYFHPKKKEWVKIPFVNSFLIKNFIFAFNPNDTWGENIAEGNNPRQLKNKEVGNGYRLLKATEKIDKNSEIFEGGRWRVFGKILIGRSFSSWHTIRTKGFNNG